LGHLLPPTILCINKYGKVYRVTSGSIRYGNAEYKEWRLGVEESKRIKL
jgi:hypothetical protein